MVKKHKLIWQDAENIAALDYIPWTKADGKTFVVTGSTGLIGGTVVRALVARGASRGSKINVVAPVRDVVRASAVFSDISEIKLLSWDALSGNEINGVEKADYVIHCAAPTSSSFFSEKPVETIDAIVGGTSSALRLAERCGASFVLASSMEVYGAGGDSLLDESLTAGVDTQNPRNSYPAAKVVAEMLCTAYAAERDMKACVARLAQTFGPGVSRDDARVFAEFARACVEGEDIRLHTIGTKQNMYVYTADAASALLLLAIEGESGLAYNVANEKTLISIRSMADEIVACFGNGHTRVVLDADEKATSRYRPDGALKLDTTRIRSLGWEPTCGLMAMYDRLIRSWREGE